MEYSVIETKTADCVHCGTPFRVTPHRSDFCCAGCEFVHGLITKGGFGQYYDLRDAANPPVTSAVFQKRDYAWLSELVTEAEAGKNPEASLTLDLQGVSCIGCVWLIEKLWQRKPGALSVRADAGTGRIALRWRTRELDLPGFAAELQSFGYLLGPPRKDAAPPSRALVLRIGLCGAFSLNTMLFTLPGYLGMERTFEFAPLFDRLTLAFSTLSLLVGGSYFINRSWRSLRHGVLHIDLPISLGLIAAYAGSLHAWLIGDASFVYFDFVSIFVFLMLAGRWLQQRSIERNRNRLLGLHAEPPRITIPGAGSQSAAGLLPGIRYTIGSGRHIPVRSKLLSSRASFGMEWINGESDAHSVRAGGVVASGALNLGSGEIELESVESWPDSMLARLLEVTPTRDQGDRTLERFIRIYIVAVLAVGMGGAGGWLLAGADLPFALRVLVSVLVVSCPCALGVALPMADELAASRLRKLGLFVRDATLWSRIGRVRKIVFDKTGTLTFETPALRDSSVLEDLPMDEKQILARLVRDNLHPVSCCLREHLMAGGIEPIGDEFTVEETVGFGLEGWISGAHWRLGRRGWGNGCPTSELADADCVFSRDGQVLAMFSIADEVRTDAMEEISALRNQGYSIHILSGDRQAKVDAMAEELGLPAGQALGEMSPPAKAEWLRKIGADDALMVGDGANDSLAFNESLCRGTPAIDRGLLEQKADFYFLGRGLGAIRQLFEVAARRRASIRAVLTFAIVYNLGAIALCLAGMMSPLAAAILMPLSSVTSLAIVVARARRHR